MRITILPAIGTNQAVCEPWDGELPIEIRSPRKLASGEQERLVWCLYRDACKFRWELDEFKHLSYEALPWLVASSFAIAFRWQDLWSISGYYLGLYSWIPLWLMADGAWLALQCLEKVRHWRRGRKMFKALKEHWGSKLIVDKELAQLKPVGQEHDKERDWIRRMIEAPDWALGHQCRHLYARLLKRYPPRLMDYWPLGRLWRYIKRMLGGVPVREPWYVYSVEI